MDGRNVHCNQCGLIIRRCRCEYPVCEYPNCLKVSCSFHYRVHNVKGWFCDEHAPKE